MKIFYLFCVLPIWLIIDVLYPFLSQNYDEKVSLVDFCKDATPLVYGAGALLWILFTDLYLLFWIFAIL